MFMETGSVTKRKADQAPFVLTEDRVDDIRQRIDVSPNKSVRNLALQTGKLQIAFIGTNPPSCAVICPGLERTGNTAQNIHLCLMAVSVQFSGTRCTPLVLKFPSTKLTRKEFRRTTVMPIPEDLTRARSGDLSICIDENSESLPDCLAPETTGNDLFDPHTSSVGEMVTINHQLPS
ncbi:hypothetical protein Trydic_g12508 [Trypoxylus dichotomus]